ncbi:MAG TPA: DHA2 family efflux MFS transporter permease subunit [Alphaproteobacteria bacterium]|nr:DHA2 family efflux MFS transporter permease subunit [Alphaproteobacteria bacterium]
MSERSPAIAMPRTNPWLVAVAVMLATFMVVLDTSIATVALPYIAGNLGATQDEATWVLTSYLVANAIVLPASAWFASFFGRKRFLIGCIIVFTLASVACGVATSMTMLVVARVLQGAGGGAMQPLSQAILLESFPPGKRGVAMAMFGIGTVFAPTIGPTLGGWLTDTYSWRWCFYINVPVGILAVFLISSLVTDPSYIRAARPKRIDGIGFGLLALWLGTLQISLDKGQEVNWFSAIWLRWFLAISAVSMVAFIIRELSTDHPITDLRVFKDRNFAVSAGIFGLFGTVLYALITLQPLFLQSLLGYDAFNAGLTITPRGIGLFAALFIVGALVQRTDARMLVAFGFAGVGLSSYLLSRMTLQVAMSNIVPANIINGFGSGFIFVPLATLAVGTLRNEEIGNATGIQNLLRNIGGSIGLSMVSTMLERSAQAHQATMVGHLSPLNPIYLRKLSGAQALFEQRFNPSDAMERARAFIYNDILIQQANYWSFVDVFYLIFWICVLCLACVFLFKKPNAVRASVAAE